MIGARFRSSLLAIRLAAVTWCLASFVLGGVYTGVVISFVTSPNYKPLVESIHDIARKSDVRLTVEATFPTDTQYLVGLIKIF